MTMKNNIKKMKVYKHKDGLRLWKQKKKIENNEELI
jgi:hypothetical protein